MPFLGTALPPNALTKYPANEPVKPPDTPPIKAPNAPAAPDPPAFIIPVAALCDRYKSTLSEFLPLPYTAFVTPPF